MNIDGKGGGGGIEGAIFCPLVLPNMFGKGGGGGIAVAGVPDAIELNMLGSGGGGGAADERTSDGAFSLLLFAPMEEEC